MLVERRFNTGEVELNYAEGPDNGPPFILIHGFPRWWRDFEPILPRLQTNHHLYTVDLRGHGGSGRVKGGYTLRDYSRDIVAVLEHIQEPAALFGHSLGGWVSLMAAAEKPDRVRAVIVGDSPLDLEDFKIKLKGYGEWWKTNREYSSKTFDELCGVLDPVSARRLSLVDPDVFDFWIEGCTDSSRFDRLFAGFYLTELSKRIRCNVLLLQGNDGTLPDRDVDYAKSVLPGITHVRFEGYGHYLGLDTGDTDELINVISAFLKQSGFQN